MVRLGWLAGVGLLAAGCGVLGAAAEPGPWAEEVLARTGVKGGLIVHLGCGEGERTAALRRSEAYLVHGLETDPAKVEAARRRIRSQGIYGPVSVALFCGKRLPYIEDVVNLLVADELGGVPMSEVMRVLAPHGTAWIGGQITVKPRPKGMDEWTHYLHDPSNNCVAHDEWIAPLARLQWIAGPFYSRHHDHMSGASAMVSAGGRVFYIFEEAPRASILIPPKWRLYARDAFNGALLWKRPIEKWHEHLYPLKSGPQLLPRRLVAAGDRVFVTMSIDGPVSALDPATGRTVRTYEGTAATEEILVAGGVLYLVVADPKDLRSDPKRTFASLADIRNDANNGPWGEASRTIMAVEAETGKALWRKTSRLMPLTLAVDDRQVYFHDGQRVLCLDRKTGEQAWASGPVATQRSLKSSAAPTLVVYDDVVLFSGYDGQRRKGEFTTMYALSARDGRTLWEAEHPPSGHAGSPKDILVLNGVVWCGATAQGSDSGISTGRDLHTGKVLKEFPPDVQTHWFHQRCYRQKATDKYLLYSRTGIEFVDVEQSHWICHHWVRGACLYGIMPANGLIYNPPHPCACYLDAKLYGFNALAPASRHWTPRRDVPDAERLEKGPAYDRVNAAAVGTPSREDASDWPTYRGDASRSGSSRTPVRENLSLLWRAPIGGKPSAVSVAEGKVFVSSVNAHTLHALDATTGKPIWAFTAGGRVDSPPTIWRGRALFGASDGFVYCLWADDGSLAWKFRAAPEDRRHVAFEQVESVWPVHGSVLVQNGAAYCVAGRSMFLDGGLRMIRLDPQTGRKLSETILDDQDPATKANLQAHIKGLNMPTALPDILSSDGRYVYMRTLPFHLDGQRKHVGYVEVKDQQGDDLHLFSPTGFLDDTLWHRTYWIYGRAFASGAGGYYQAGRIAPAGRILVFDQDHVYGYGRRWQYYRWTTPMEFHLFATAKRPEQVRMGEEPKPARGKDGKPKFAAASVPLMRFHYAWSNELAVQVTAMALADKTLFVAGPPDLIDEEEAARTIGNPETKRKLAEQEAALEGQRGSLLAAVAAGDGARLAAYRLDSAPIFDGMAAAGGRLYLSMLEGSVVCLGSGGGPPLPRAPDEIVKPRPPDADKPQGKIPPATTSKGKAAKKPPAKRAVTHHPDFQHVEGAAVAASGLGYRVAVDGASGFALKRLPEPLSGQVTFSLKILPTAEGKLQTGFLAFGDGVDESQLVKCGARFRMKKCFILQGEAKQDEAAGQALTWEAGKPIDLVVSVDLAAGTVRMTMSGQTVEARLRRPLQHITHVGYYVMNAVTEFSPIVVAPR